MANEEGTPRLVTQKPLILDEELSIKANSKYGELWQSTPNDLMNLLAGAFGIPSGQFTLQGVQIWQSTDPISLSFEVELQMDTDPYEDVIIPTRDLMSLVLPKKSKITIGKETANSNLKLSTLIPPGPNVQAIVNLIKSDNKVANVASKLLERFGTDSRGVYKVVVGYATFNNVIITSVEPTFSKEMAYSNSKRNYFPSSASLSVQISTMEMATTDMMDTIF
jgi:hypothetical protein